MPENLEKTCIMRLDSEDEVSFGRTSPRKMMSNRTLDVGYMEIQVVSACQFPDYGVRGVADITTFVITFFLPFSSTYIHRLSSMSNLESECAIVRSAGQH